MKSVFPRSPGMRARLFLAPAVHAADAQLGHVVVTATRQPISADAALASVDVIEGATKSPAPGHSSLLGLLSSRPGVQMARNGGPGSSGSIFIRGANSGHAGAGRWGA